MPSWAVTVTTTTFAPACLTTFVQGLRHEAVQVLLDPGPQVQALFGAVHRDRHLLSRRERRALLAQGHHQTLLGQGPRPQLEDQRPHLGQRTPGQLGQVGNGTPSGADSSKPAFASDSWAARACMVIENRAWLTESCKSRASRDRSSTAAACLAWDASRALVTATAARPATQLDRKEGSCEPARVAHG
jgi:hypothetical protein